MKNTILLLAVFLVSQSALADSPPHPSWVLSIREESGALRQEVVKQKDHSFRDGNFLCEINCAISAEPKSNLDRALFARSLRCRSANGEERVSGAVCGDGSPQGTGQAAYVNGRTYRLFCNMPNP